MNEADEGTTVTVTSKGQATIPKEFREKLQIDTPGRVRFLENDNGEVVIRPVERPADLRGALAADDQQSEADWTTTELLRQGRERDEHQLDDERGFSDREK